VVSGLGGSIFPDQLNGQFGGSVVSNLENQGYTVHEVAWNDPNPTSAAGLHGDPGSFNATASVSTTTIFGVSVPTGDTADVSVDLGRPNTPDQIDPQYDTDFVDSVVGDLETNDDAHDTIVLIGYSLGGASVLDVANKLAQDFAAGKTSARVSLLALLDPVGYVPGDASNPSGVVAGLESGSYIIHTFAPSIQALLNDGISLTVNTQFVNGTDGKSDGKAGPVNDDRSVPGFRASLPAISASNITYIYNRYQRNVPFPFDLEASASIAATPERSIVNDFSLDGQPIPDQAESATTTPHQSTPLDVLYGVVSNPLDLLSPVTTDAEEHAIFPYDPTIQKQINVIVDGVTPEPPTAVAKLDAMQPVSAGETITLDGLQSRFQPARGESNQLAYQWSEVSGPTIPAKLISTSLNSPDLTFQVPRGGDYVFMLAVTTPDGLFDSATVSFSATTATAAQLVVTSSPPASVNAGTPFGLTVVAEDAAGNVVGSFDGAVTAIVSSGPPGASLGGPITVSAIAGVAVFSDLTLVPAGSYTLQVVGSTLTATPEIAVAVEEIGPPRLTGVAARSTRRGLTAITATFDEALLSSSASSPSLFRVFGAVKKHRTTVYGKLVKVSGVTYDPVSHAVTVRLSKAYKGAVSFTILAGLLGADGAATQTSSTEYLR
jgi:pimeloyl-ACP methyl ester carboxylesterase